MSLLNAQFLRKSLFSAVQVVFLVCAVSGFAIGQESAPQKPIDDPIIVNGDIVEYSTDNREVTATGNVEVIYKGTRLSCKKLTVNMQTKDAVAEGNARIEDKQSVFEGEKIVYNFDKKIGSISKGEFRAEPYYGKAEKLEKVAENQFVGTNGQASTCSFDHPHYGIKCKTLDVIPQDRLRTKNDTFYFGKFPVAYLPVMNRDLKTKKSRYQFTPGYSKRWGAYLLSNYRYDLGPGVTGRLYADYRQNWGMAEGFGLNYKTPSVGKGDFKFYYTQERDKNQPEGTFDKFERYLARWRHQWDIDDRTTLTNEYYKITDSKRALLGPDHNFLKDYFQREYDKDSQPLSYTLLHHNFNYSSFDFMVQKRINNWYTQLEKLPEIDYSLPSTQMGESPFYFQNNSQFVNYNYKYAAPSPGDLSMQRVDTTNRISVPTRVAFIGVTPFVASRQTMYNENVYDQSVWDRPRTVFYTGADLSTKFYRTFEVQTNFMGLDINKLRHVITPTINYAYNHDPTVPSYKLKQFDSVDTVSASNVATLELSNKLQTKREGQSVDIADLRVSSPYSFKPKGGPGSSFGDYLFKLELLPYSWMRFAGDATYSHRYDYFTGINYDWNFTIQPERTIGFGQRVQHKGGNELTFNTGWRLTPKWKASVYERYQFTKMDTLKHGFREQEYSLTRDLHCWDMSVMYNVKKDIGNEIWLIFRLKAFPEMEVNLNQSYNAPKAGSQTP